MPTEQHYQRLQETPDRPKNLVSHLVVAEDGAREVEGRRRLRGTRRGENEGQDETRHRALGRYGKGGRWGGEVTAPKRGREAKTWRARRELGSTEVLARGTKPEVLEIAPSVFSRKRSETGPKVMLYFLQGVAE